MGRRAVPTAVATPRHLQQQQQQASKLKSESDIHPLTYPFEIATNPQKSQAVRTRNKKQPPTPASTNSKKPNTQIKPKIQKMTSPIPTPYKILITLFEPLLATSGALNALLSPSTLVSATLPTIRYTPTLYPLFTQQTGAWLLLAFHDFVTLRSEPYKDDVRIWRHTLMASGISDVFYIASLLQSMGPGLFFNPARWDFMTAVTVVTTVTPFLGKLCFLAGVGLPKKTSKERKRK
jgi:hypothetical protein